MTNLNSIRKILIFEKNKKYPQYNTKTVFILFNVTLILAIVLIHYVKLFFQGIVM